MGVVIEVSFTAPFAALEDAQKVNRLTAQRETKN
jgi:hypothetical protein